MKIFLAILFFVVIIQPAFCYIDPGTGSMLLYAVIGIAAALLYACKGFFYKLKAKATGKNYALDSDLSNYDFVFYSEGKQYWSTFKPLLEAMDKNKKCIYLTSSNDDKGLEYKTENIETKYIGDGAIAATYLNNIKTDIVVMTTPQLDILTIKRSKKVKHYSHLLHSPSDVSFYQKYAFDYFDSVLCSGKYQIKHIRELEEKRGTPVKKLCETGLMVWDILVKTPKRSIKNDCPVILVAPTWGKTGLLTRFGFDILESLLTGKYKIILRPHPQMYVSQKDLIKSIIDECKKYPDIAIDEKPSGEESMNKSDILLSDISGIIFDYAFCFKKPVITVDAPIITAGFEIEDIDNEESYELKAGEKFGKLVNEKEIEKLPLYVDELLNNYDIKNIDKIIQEDIFNFGNAAEVAVKQLVEIREKIK